MNYIYIQTTIIYFYYLIVLKYYKLNLKIKLYVLFDVN